MIEEVLTQIPGKEALIALTAIQTVAYAAICEFFGYILAKKQDC